MRNPFETEPPEGTTIRVTTDYGTQVFERTSGWNNKSIWYATGSEIECDWDDVCWTIARGTEVLIAEWASPSDLGWKGQ